MRALGLVTAVIVASCTDDPVHPAPVATKTADYVTMDAPAFCHVFTTDCPRKTGETFDQCVKIYEATRVPPDCKKVLDTLTCDWTQAELDPCWPACSGQSAECDGTNIIECSSSGRKYTYECHGVCATQGKTWSGVCSAAYKGQTASQPTCWCN